MRGVRQGEGAGQAVFGRLGALLAASLLLGAAGDARAGEFFAIVANLTDARKPHAVIDYAGDSNTWARATAPIVFQVFDVFGIELSEFTLQTNSNGFAGSGSAAPPNDNLFDLSAGAPVLVRSQNLDVCSDEYAVLRQNPGTTSAVVLGVPPLRHLDTPVALGTLFPVALGDIGSRATLLVANVSGTDIMVDVFLGTKGADGTGNPSIPRLKPNSLGIMEFDASHAHSNLIISSTGDIIAQLAVDTGRKGSLTEVTLIPVH